MSFRKGDRVEVIGAARKDHQRYVGVVGTVKGPHENGGAVVIPDPECVTRDRPCRNGEWWFGGSYFTLASAESAETYIPEDWS